MKRYTANINIGGDRNHVVVKSNITAAEILVLQAIHGSQDVYNITAGAGAYTQTGDLKAHLEEQYGRTKVGPESDRRPVLAHVFPGWPHRVEFPDNVKAAGVDASLVNGGEESEAPQGPEPVKQRTYWKTEDGAVGIAEKGELVPEGAETIRKGDYQVALEALEQKQASENDFTE